MNVALLAIGIVIMILLIAIGTFTFFRWDAENKIADYQQGLMEKIYDNTVPYPLPPKTLQCATCPDRANCRKGIEACTPCATCEKRRTCKGPDNCPERFFYYSCATPFYENGKQTIKPCEVCVYAKRIEKKNGKVEYACLYDYKDKDFIKEKNHDNGPT